MDHFTLQSLCMTLPLLICSTFIFLFLRRLKSMTWKLKSRSQSAIKTPPSPPGFPLIGHLRLLTDMPHHAFAKLANQLGPIFLLRLGQVPTLVISSAHLARLVLKAQDHVFANRPQLVSAQYLSFGCSDVTFSPYGAYWRQARKICVTELLSSKRVSSFEKIRDEEVNRLLSSLLSESGPKVDISKLFFRLANDVLCRVAFGRRFMEVKEEDESAGTKKNKNRSLVDVMGEAQALFAGFSAGDFYPKWKWVDWVSGFKQRLEKTQEDLRVVGDEIIDEHIRRSRKEETTTLDKEDFVDVLLRVQRQKDLEVPITDDNLKALVLSLVKIEKDLRDFCNYLIQQVMRSLVETTMRDEDFVNLLMRVKQQDNLEVQLADDNLKALVMDMFVAGTDTTSSTLEWTMTELIRHPKVLKKAQDEVRKVVSNTGKVEENHLQHLHYMKAVVKETMRIHPSVPLLVPRESMEKCILDGYEIPAKTRVLINIYAIGRDPESWENPLEYNPERFVENNIDVRDQEFRFLPFGGGRRGCPGYAFGLATVEIALARLLYHFDWALPEGVTAEDVDLEEHFGLATKKKTALVLVPTVNKQCEFKETISSS